MFIFWKTKTYEHSIRATIMSVLGQTTIAVALILTPVTILVINDIGFHSSAWAFLGLQAVFLLIGVPLTWFAPKQAKKDMDKLIKNGFPSARPPVPLWRKVFAVLLTLALLCLIKFIFRNVS